MKTYNGLVHLNGNLMVSMDFETTGLEAGYHEIVQIGIVPLNADLQPSKEIRPFYHNLAPKHAERASGIAGRVHGLDLADLMLNALSSERVADLLVDWCEALELPRDKILMPLGFNWEFEASHGKAWLGQELFNQIFHGHARDGMRLAISMNDRASFAGETIPFQYVSLKSICKYFGIVNETPHDALSDALTEAKAYRALLHHGLFE